MFARSRVSRWDTLKQFLAWCWPLPVMVLMIFATGCNPHKHAWDATKDRAQEFHDEYHYYRDPIKLGGQCPAMKGENPYDAHLSDTANNKWHRNSVCELNEFEKEKLEGERKRKMQNQRIRESDQRMSSDAAYRIPREGSLSPGVGGDLTVQTPLIPNPVPNHTRKPARGNGQNAGFVPKEKRVSWDN